MGAIANFLFPAPAARSTAGIFRWWEARRLHYNLIVGVTGIFSVGVAGVVSALPPGSSQLPPILPVAMLYAFFANICYCAGPLAELLLERVWPRRLLPPGPALFRMGLTFSVGLTLFPPLVLSFDWIRRILFWLL